MTITVFYVPHKTEFK